jgi:hypothetical protein
MAASHDIQKTTAGHCITAGDSAKLRNTSGKVIDTTVTGIDLREQLYNDRAQGPVTQVQLPLERITVLRGILIDLDPALYKPGNPLFTPDDDPTAFFDNIRPVVDRHPLARFAEIRMTGTGLHVIVWLDPPAELKSAADQERWQVLVRTVQCTLPGDWRAPGITALTRPVGSINSKNGAAVAILRPGQPVPAADVEQFVGLVAKATFRQVATVLLGSENVQPCPVCRGADSGLAVLDDVGKCYAKCGKVTLDQIYDCVFAGSREGKKGTPEVTQKADADAAPPEPATSPTGAASALKAPAAAARRATAAAPRRRKSVKGQPD